MNHLGRGTLHDVKIDICLRPPICQVVILFNRELWCSRLSYLWSPIFARPEDFLFNFFLLLLHLVGFLNSLKILLHSSCIGLGCGVDGAARRATSHFRFVDIRFECKIFIHHLLHLL